MHFSNLQSWLDWQETLHPNEIELGLERIQQVWHSLYPTEFKPVVITVAGTNGKGSSCAMLESIYLASGYQVGCYTSPHFLRYTERIRLQGKEIDAPVLCEAFEAVDQARGEQSLTYFEFGTLAALWLFAQADLDVVILEVGLGGRLDAVNIMDADVALLTSVGLDHMDWLGYDRETIGLEKAGIFRSGRPAVCAESVPPQSVLKYAEETGAICLIQDRDFSVTQGDTGWSWHGPDDQARHSLLAPALRGDIQIRNASAVLMVLQSLADRLPVNQAHLRQGLLAATIPGRFQVVAGDVPIILDVAHNPDAARVLRANLMERHCQGKTYAVCGMLADKDSRSVIEVMADMITAWYVVSVAGARGASAEQLTEQIETLAMNNIHLSVNVSEAIEQARKQTQPGDQIIVFGSFYVVADALKMLHV